MSPCSAQVGNSLLCVGFSSALAGAHTEILTVKYANIRQKIWSRDVKLHVHFTSDVRIKKQCFVKTWKDDSILNLNCLCNTYCKVVRIILICVACGKHSLIYKSHPIYINGFPHGLSLVNMGTIRMPGLHPRAYDVIHLGWSGSEHLCFQCIRVHSNLL